MPWKEETAMSLRLEFVHEATKEDANIRGLCRQYEVSPTTGYKWLRRYRTGGEKALADRSRRPHYSPRKTPKEIESLILAVRQEHPTWGGRKIKAYLEQRGHSKIPSPSTITAILKRQSKIDPEKSLKHRPYQRFEKEAPNQMWQMDFKGYFGLDKGIFCHPLTVLDDHSRYLVGLKACANETSQTVQAQLTDVFRCYGLPDSILVDNGSPWGDNAHTHHTVFTTWLLRLGVDVIHSRPYHPQTLGKDERLHRTLQEELLSQSTFTSLLDCQKQFNIWRRIYNFERPHQALDLLPPASRYQSSLRPFPETLPPIIYDLGSIVRKVDQGGKIYFRNRTFRVGKAFRHYPVALRPADIDGIFEVYFCSYRVAQITLYGDSR